jgi:hypothetical protein
MVVDVVKDFFLKILDLEWVCMGCVGKEMARFSGAGAVDTVERFGEDELVGEIVFELG